MPDENRFAPVSTIPGDERRPVEAGIGLCLSGGGYRAMLFHAGVIWRLNEAGLLPHLKRISSVSGGSLTAGVLGTRWKRLRFAGGVADNLPEEFLQPILRMASRSIDVGSVLASWLPGITVSDRLSSAYDSVLFAGATLQDLPADDEGPRFVINASNVQSGALWRFSRPYMADYRVGRWISPKLRLSLAVAASSAFPPVLSPCFVMPDGPPDEPYELGRPPFTSDVELTDGGVYDNLGLETVFKRYRTVLASDAGREFDVQADPADDYLRHTRRVIELMQNQVIALRKRLLLAAYDAKVRGGAYWGLGSDISGHDPFGLLGSAAWGPLVSQAATFETRLRAVDPPMQRALINWGYAVCAANLQRFAAPHLQQEYGIQLRAADRLPFTHPTGASA